jgi:hypothetical protein
VTSQNDKDTGRFVTLEFFSSVEDAQIVRSRLETEGVRAIIPKEQIASPIAGDVSVLVHAYDLDHAKRIVEAIDRGEYVIDDDLSPSEKELKLQRDGNASSQSEVKESTSRERTHESHLITASHLLLAILSAFVLLSQQPWDMLDIAKHNYGWEIAAIAISAGWPYVTSWIYCRGTVASRLCTSTFIVVLVVGFITVDITYIRSFRTLGWASVAALTIVQTATYLVAATLLFDRRLDGT